MTLPLDTVLTLAATAAGLAFLTICAWHNHRAGYRKIRPSESPVQEVMAWLSALNGAPACEEVPVPSTSAAAISSMITGADLLALEAVLGRQDSQKPVMERTPEPVYSMASREQPGKNLRAA